MQSKMGKKLETKTKSVKRKRVKTSKTDNETYETPKAEVLDSQGVREGMVLLGCVTEIRPSSLLVSLPGCLVGTVPLGNVSAKYTELLLGSTEEEDEQVGDLSSVVELGGTYPCRVQKVTQKEKPKRPSIVLSIDPQVVNSELRLHSLYLKMVLHASVQSIEDHGYIMDIGVKGVQGFLSFSTSSGNKNLAQGQIVHTSVRKLPNDKKGNVVWLSKIDANEALPEIDKGNMKLTSILPGAHVTAYITEVKQPFIYMKCMSFSACANMMSLGSTNQKLLEATKVSGIVLCVHPLSHMIYLHLGPIPTPSTFNTFFKQKRFDFAKNVKFDYFSHQRMIFRLNKGAMGFVQKNNMPEKGFLSEDALSKNPVIPRARVVFLHYLDNLVQLSLKESTINMEIIKPEEVQIGDIYEATVSRHVEGGMYVSVCHGFSGFVRNIHLSDSLVSMPDKLFPVGAKVKCRVVSVQEPLSFNMSCKESLLKCSPENILLSYEQAERGHFYRGVIVQRTNIHMLILFFNEVKGLVPSDEIPESSVFFVGQSVSCSVLHSDPTHKRLWLSLMPEDARLSKTHQKAPKLSSMEDKEEESEPDPTKKHRAIIKSKTSNQLNVVLEGGKLGRVHVTEICNAKEGSIPLRSFKPFQRISVHIVGSYDSPSRNFLHISHRRLHMNMECAATFPPPTPLRGELLKGMDVTGYVKEANNTSCTLWLSPVQTATLEYLHISDNPKELRKLKKKMKNGLAIKAKVLEVEKVTRGRETHYNITLTKLDGPVVQCGRTLLGLVQVASPEKGLVVRLPHGYQGTAPLSCLQDTPAPVQGMLDKCRKLAYVRCHVMEVNHSTRSCLVSLRKSRIFGVESYSEVPHPEITPSTLRPGSLVQGYVWSSQQTQLLVNLGPGVDGRVELHGCATHDCGLCEEAKEIAEKYSPGEVVEVKVDGNNPTEGLYPLSLPGLELSQEGRLSAAEDIDMEEV